MVTFELKECLEQPLPLVLDEVPRSDLNVDNLLAIQTQLIMDNLRLQSLVASLQQKLRKKRKRKSKAQSLQSIENDVPVQSTLGKRPRMELPKVAPLKQSRIDRME